MYQVEAPVCKPRLTALLVYLHELEHHPTRHHDFAHVCVGECAPDDECPCCLGSCRCPPVTAGWWFARLLEARPRLYRSRPPGRGRMSRPILTGDTSVRAVLMGERAAVGVDLFGRQLDGAACLRLVAAMGGDRNRNGTDKKAVTRGKA